MYTVHRTLYSLSDSVGLCRSFQAWDDHIKVGVHAVPALPCQAVVDVQVYPPDVEGVTGRLGEVSTALAARYGCCWLANR